MKAIIIGGGIGGLALALFLKKAGKEIEIFEASNGQANVGGGLGLAPNGLNVLDSLGLSTKVIEAGTVLNHCWFRNAKGKTLARIRYSIPERYAQPAIGISRAALHRILSEEVMGRGMVIHYGKKLIGIREDARVEAIFEDGSIASGDVLVGADGIGSSVRNFLFPEGPKPTFTGIVGSGGFVDRAFLKDLGQEDLESLNLIFGQNGFLGFAGAGPGRIMWWTSIKTDRPYNKEELNGFDQEKEKELLMEKYGNYAYPVRELIRHSEKLLRVNIFDIQSLPGWSSQKVVLMGDAAHAVSPNSGQGASMALEDAIVLAKLLRDEPDVTSAFVKFEADRKFRVEKIVLEGRRRGGDKTIVSPFQQWIRERMISIFVSLFGVKGNKWLFEYKTDWEN